METQGRHAMSIQGIRRYLMSQEDLPPMQRGETIEQARCSGCGKLAVASVAEGVWTCGNPECDAKIQAELDSHSVCGGDQAVFEG
jgi:ribosomal protein L37AE/L43A